MYSLVGGSDYEALDNYVLILTVDRHRTFFVTIIDDPSFELDVENFTLELRTADSSVLTIVSPNTTTINIIDNEGTIAILMTILSHITVCIYVCNNSGFWCCDWFPEHFLYCE